MSLSTGLSDDARNVITIVTELNLLDKTAMRTLEQVFANRVSDDLTQSLIYGKEHMLARALFRVVTHLSAAGPLGYTLRFLSDVLQVSPVMAKYFSASDAVEVFGEDPCKRFLEFADTWHNEAGICRPANLLAASILRYSPKGLRQNFGSVFLMSAGRILHSADYSTCRDLEFMMHAIAVYLKARHNRSDFREAKLVQHLPRVLSYVCGSTDSAANVQMMYETLLVCWILSYDYRCLAILAKEKLLAVVHKALQRAVKEKCIRMAVLILKNFGHAQQAFNAHAHGHPLHEWMDTSALDALMASESTIRAPTFFSDMIGIGMLKTLWQLQRKKYGDEDIPKDIEALIQLLESNLDDLTSFSEYQGEVDSKVLEWSPVHTSVKFWKENCRMFEKNNYEVLVRLVELLDSPSDVTVAVACHDIGELVRHHPNGRLLLEIPGLDNPKTRIMRLMSHSNSDISRNALLAVQKIMVQRWEFLQQQ